MTVLPLRISSKSIIYVTIIQESYSINFDKIRVVTVKNNSKQAKTRGLELGALELGIKKGQKQSDSS